MTLLTFVSLAYLYIPILIFLVGWTRWYIAVLSLGCVVASIFIASRKFQFHSIKLKKNEIIALIVLFMLTVLLCIFCGVGGFVQQTDDWRKHYFFIEQLSNNSWPVVHTSDSGTGLMSFYIGAYIIPAIAAKLTGSMLVSDIVNLLWVATGIFLVVLFIYKTLETNKIGDVFVILAFVALFTTFLVPISQLFEKLFPNESTGDYYYFSNSVAIQYYSNIENLRWAYTHAVWGWLAGGLLIAYKDKKFMWGILLLPCMFYSVFSFIGVIAIALIVYIIDLIKSDRKLLLLKDLLCPGNVVLIPPFSIISYYLLSVFLSDKHIASPDAFKSGFIFSFDKAYIFISFMFIWAIWALIVVKTEKRNSLFYGVVVFLLILPLVSYGEFNDLCIRASIPGLFILMYFAIKKFLNSGTVLWVKCLIVGVICLCCIPMGIFPIVNSCENGLSYSNRSVSFVDIEDFAEQRGEFVKYQYYVWNVDNIERFIFKI